MLHSYFFVYQVTIENHSPHTVQLLARHWIIWDSNGITHEVKGDGVIGEQPILAPGEMHEYTSFCPLTTELGRMHGTYRMKRNSDGLEFQVNIPQFDLVADFKMN